ncbi:MAG: NAD(P)H-dependent oxidoreductase subunit E [Syntrophobacteraceae bacterium]
MKTHIEAMNQVEDPRFSMINRALKRHRYRHDALIEVLHVVQKTFGYLPEDALIHISRQMQLPPSWVYGVGPAGAFEQEITVCASVVPYP